MRARLRMRVRVEVMVQRAQVEVEERMILTGQEYWREIEREQVVTGALDRQLCGEFEATVQSIRSVPLPADFETRSISLGTITTVGTATKPIMEPTIRSLPVPATTVETLPMATAAVAMATAALPMATAAVAMATAALPMAVNTTIQQPVVQAVQTVQTVQTARQN